ncbi:MAG TPA: RpiB/LacA/LacB family sugar-phosphate isomerase [Candidatus Saccharimonadales bacterium]|nr:RpiB/LacA/LacB family sugar-phosphate isomerase [Candidatus Saccharimonadales bacterium]
MKIALAADHAGFEQLKDLQAHLERLGHDCQNFGPSSLDPNDDYPDFIFPAAKAVAGGQFEAGIILGRSGQGEAMAANRIRGVRCAVFYGPAVAKGLVDTDGQSSHNPYEVIIKSRQHNHANMLSLGTAYLNLDEMKNVIKLWLDTPYADEERHNRRVQKLDQAG